MQARRPVRDHHQLASSAQIALFSILLQFTDAIGAAVKVIATSRLRRIAGGDFTLIRAESKCALQAPSAMRRYLTAGSRLGFQIDFEVVVPEHGICFS